MKFIIANMAMALISLLPKTTQAQYIDECEIMRLMVDTITSFKRIDTVNYEPKILSLNPITGEWDTGDIERTNISSSIVIFDENFWPIGSRDVKAWISELTEDSTISGKEYKSISVDPKICMFPQQFSPHSSFYVDSTFYSKNRSKTIFAKNTSGEMDSISLSPIRMAISNFLLSKDSNIIVSYVICRYLNSNFEDRWIFVFSKFQCDRGDWYIKILKRIPPDY